MINKVKVVVGSFFTQFIVVGMLFTYGVLMTELEKEFGWSRTLLSSIGAAGWLAWGILAIPGGFLNDRLGPKIVLGVNGCIFGIGFILFSKSSEAWHLFLIFIFFIGAGLSTHDISTLSTIAKWFESKRGLMTSIAKIGTAMGQMVMPPLIAFLIVAYGWRTATFYLGIAASIGLVLAASIMSVPKNSNEASAIEEIEVEEEFDDIDVPFAVIEDVPIFPGCESVAKSQRRACFQEQMNKHIRKNFRYPDIAQEMGIQGRVYVNFIIAKDGSITNIRMRGPDKNLENEAARIIGRLPQMTPGKQRGRAVRVPFSIPITFRLQ